MIIHMAEGATIDQVERVINRITQDYGLRCETIVSSTTVIGIKGIASVVDEGRILELPGVDRVIRITEKYKDASRTFHHEDTIVWVGGVPVGARTARSSADRVRSRPNSRHWSRRASRRRREWTSSGRSWTSPAQAPTTIADCR
jgi:hypothetical protein